MSDMAWRQGRTVAVATALIVLGAVAWLAAGSRGKEAPPVTSNQITPDKLRELRQKAAAGDAAAQYALTLYTDDAVEAEQLLKRAADGGYPPAIVTFSQALMGKGGAQAAQAKTVLEGAAQRGYYPAIVELVHCLEAGECGPPSKVDAYTWIGVADVLAQQGKIANSQLSEEEKRLRPQLTQPELDRARASAQTIAQRVPAAGAR